MIGTTISHYRIVDRLGAGGMGEVYLAEDTKLHRQVALKFLPPSLWNESEAQQRLIREAQAASKLDHPNVVTIYGIDEADGRPFISMARVKGVSLKEYCTSERRTVEELVQLVIQIADGLQHAHEAGVIHRDLKPSNILVDDRGRARILDFGIASLRGAAKLTQTGSTVGTMAYAPPELAQGRQAVPASDIYSLGVVMYQMLSGRLPFEADHEAALLYAILHDEPQPLGSHRPDIPDTLQDVVATCLAKNPEQRYSECQSLIEALRKALPQPAAQAEAEIKDKPSIAVLPFTNMSADPENEYFSDGLTEELLNVLARNPELKVTGRTSSFAFKGKLEDLRDIGQKLGVETVLEGSVRKAGNRVRITAQLVKSSDGFHLWSDTYDRVVDDIFAVQDDIAASVSKALDVTLLGKKETPTKVNAETYSLVLQADHFSQQNAVKPVARAVEMYKEALAMDSRNARAWAGLARARLLQYGYGHEDSAFCREEIADAAKKALAIDSQIAQAHDVLGWARLVFDLDWRGADESFERANELAPSDAKIVSGLAAMRFAQGRIEEGLKLSYKSVLLDPLDPMAYSLHGRNLTMAERLDEAYDVYGRALELSPDLASAHVNRGVILVLQGHPEEALAEIEQERSAGYRNYGLAIAYDALGKRAESDAALAVLLTPELEEYAVQRAAVYDRRGELDSAYEELEKARDIRDAGLHLVPAGPLHAGVRSDPRWQAFLDSINYPKEYRKHS